MTQHSVARAYSIMQEVHQLRDKAHYLSERNADLAKALTWTKQELTKARAAQTAVFSGTVLQWMEARCKPCEVQHKATQCSFRERDEADEEYQQFELDPPLSPAHRFDSVQTGYSRSRTSSPTANAVTSELERSGCKRNGNTDLLVTDEWQADEDYDGPIERKATDDRTKSKQATGSSMCTRDSTGRDRVDSLAEQHRHIYSSPAVFCSDSRRTKTAVTKRLRQRGTSVSYVEPKLNTKLRRGDYYGLGKQAARARKHGRRSGHRATADTRCTDSASMSGSFSQQFSPCCRHRAMRSVQRISYAEPKLNTKLRRGDKFTFTT